MIPAKYLEDLKTAPIDKVDFVATFIEVSDAMQCVSIQDNANADMTELDV